MPRGVVAERVPDFGELTRSPPVARNSAQTKREWLKSDDRDVVRIMCGRGYFEVLKSESRLDVSSGRCSLTTTTEPVPAAMSRCRGGTARDRGRPLRRVAVALFVWRDSGRPARGARDTNLS